MDATFESSVLNSVSGCAAHHSHDVQRTSVNENGALRAMFVTRIEILPSLFSDGDGPVGSLRFELRKVNQTDGSSFEILTASGRLRR